jgi:hypothetical protein
MIVPPRNIAVKQPVTFMTNSEYARYEGKCRTERKPPADLRRAI